MPSARSQAPEAVLAYLSRYTHRVAIANSRLIAHDERSVTFKWKDYRAKNRERYKTMRLVTGEFIRRFLLHVLPTGFHRIRHYGLFASHLRQANLAKLRNLLCVDTAEGCPSATSDDDSSCGPYICQACGAPMRIIDRLEPLARAPPTLKAA